MGEWKGYKLGEVALFKNGKSRPAEEGAFPIYGGNGILGYTNNFNSENEVVIIGRVGAYCGSVYFENTPIWISDNALFGLPKKGHDIKFLFYFLKNLNLNNFAEGSSHPLLTQNLLNSIDVQITDDINEQKSIASILSSLDDKIDLLHRQNKTLEALAETLFRQWFVEEAEEGGEAKSLLDVIELIGGGTPKTEVTEYWGGNIKWISAKDITPNHKGFITETEKKITELGLENSSAKILPKFATVISARGTVGKYCLLAEDMAFSQSNYGIKPKFKDCYSFTYLLVANCTDELQAAAYGSVFDTITTNTFKEHKIQMPPEAEIQAFEKDIKSYFEKMLVNCNQIHTLTRLSDTLLPKLLSGEVRVKDAAQRLLEVS